MLMKVGILKEIRTQISQITTEIYYTDKFVPIREICVSFTLLPHESFRVVKFKPTAILICGNS